MKTSKILILISSIFLCSSCGSKSNEEVNYPTTDDISHETTTDDISDETTTDDISHETIEKFQKGMESFRLFIADISDANALGIKKENFNHPISKSPECRSNTKRKNEPRETVQTLVKTTTNFNSNDPNLNDDGTLNVTFKKIDTTITTSIVDGEIDIIATRKNDDYCTVEYSISNNALIINTELKHQYRVLDKDDNVKVEWFNGTGSSKIIDYLNIDSSNPIDSFKVECRSADAFISYKDIEDCSYSIYLGDQLISQNLNKINNSSHFSGNLFSFDGLLEGELYTLKYHYIGEETSIKQSDVGGEIDKAYVYNERFSFVSFVPVGYSNRPNDSELEFDFDGIPLYDKTDYFSSDTRQSFVVDNNSGLFYKIENFLIKKFNNGLIVTDKDKLIYDFKIENDNFVIFPLFTNTTIDVYDFFKDKYGNIVISNSRLETYDSSTNTTYFIGDESYDVKTDTVFSHGEHFAFTSDKRLLHFKVEGYDRTGFWNTSAFSDIYLLGSNSEHVALSRSDSFYAINKIMECRSLLVKNGNFYLCASPFSEEQIYTDWGNFVYYNCETKESIIAQFGAEDYMFDFSYVQRTGLAIVYFKSEMSIYYCDIFDLVAFFETEYNQDVSHLKTHLVLNGTTLEDNQNFLIYGIHGNEYYDIVVEQVGDSFVVNKYLTGTYQAPQKMIILQPIR